MSYNNSFNLQGYVSLAQSNGKCSNGQTYYRFHIAVNNWNPKTKETETDFFQCVVFGRLADSMVKAAPVGRRIDIKGRIKSDRYEDLNGRVSYPVSFIVQHVVYLNDNPNKEQRVEDEQESSYYDREFEIAQEKQDYLNQQAVGSSEIPF